MFKNSTWIAIFATGIPILCAAIFGVAIRTGWVDEQNWPTGHVDNLGAENDEIAKAIRAGRGFADPFRTPSGPTAWVPPVMPSILVLLYAIAGDDRTTVVNSFMVLQCIFLFLAFLPIIGTNSNRVELVIAIFTFAIAVIAKFEPLFQITYDHALQMVLVTVIWLQFQRACPAQDSKRVGCRAGALGGFVALVNPVLGAVWAAIFCWIYRSCWSQIVIAGAISMLVIAPWCVRNRIVLGKWVPIKSNSSFEAWQSLTIDQDGIVDTEAFRVHPYLATQGTEAKHYKALGEIAYLEEKSQLWLAAVRKSPDLFIQQSFNRLAAAFFMYSPVALSEYNFPRKLAMNRIWNAMPMVCILIALFWKNFVFSSKLIIALWIWVLGLLPYVLISYYDRYSWPLLPMQVVIIAEVLAGIWLSTFGVNRCARPESHEHSSSLLP